MQKPKNKIAVFGGGCFWCTEAVFATLKGVVSVVPGYAGGTKINPTYEEVSSENTGHAEVIKLEYAPEIISYEDLLTVFFYTHDPTTKDRQGNDIGSQYRSIILYADDEQKAIAENFIAELNLAAKPPSEEKKPIVTELKLLDKFYEAEKYHKEYFKKNPNQAYCQLVIPPKIKKLEKRFKELIR